MLLYFSFLTEIGNENLKLMPLTELLKGLTSQNQLGAFFPVAYKSHKLIDTEQRYHIHNKELAAIVHCVKKWRFYLKGPSFYPGYSQTIICSNTLTLKHICHSVKRHGWKNSCPINFKSCINLAKVLSQLMLCPTCTQQLQRVQMGLTPTGLCYTLKPSHLLQRSEC